ncbi:Mitogen-activated protein kinase kinase kinase kinase 3 [Armadillidium vulgare]|nr:Mitogen-activated protein kinase kinase kinase kinase 3 [Armadillidium vulgare]
MKKGPVMNVPQRITSRTPARKAQKAHANSQDVDIPFGEADAEAQVSQYRNSSQIWDAGAEIGENDLDNHDLATAWANSDPDDEVKTKSLLQYIDEELRSRATLPIGGLTDSVSSSGQRLDNENQNSHASSAAVCTCQEQGNNLEDLSASIPELSLNSSSTTGNSSFNHDSGSHVNNVRGSSSSTDSPPVPPPRRERSHPRRHNTPPKPMSNGLPPTPKVHMGACFSKVDLGIVFLPHWYLNKCIYKSLLNIQVFNGCPLHIHCTASWIHPASRDQHILIGAEEGIYTLNLNEIHEAAMEQLFPARTSWMVVIKDVLMSISGKGPNLYRHDLIGLHNKHFHKFSLPMNKIPEKLLPRKYTITTKVPETKGTLKCCIGRNPYNGYKYLCGATTTTLYLMQWYDPLNKFMLLKQTDCYLQHPLHIFEMIITPDLEYPLICTDVTWGATSEEHVGPPPLHLNLIDLNTGMPWVGQETDMGTMRPRCTQMNITNVTQIEKDTILVCFDNVVRVVDLQGRIKERRKIMSEIKFDFIIDSVVCLTDSVLAFHLHGMTGRSFKNGEITQEIVDNSRCFRLLGSDRIITLESRPSSMSEVEAANQGVNLYILAGHETSMY